MKVTVLAGMAENMPSSTAFRPSDVLTMHSGKTVENTNSDAEDACPGRRAVVGRQLAPDLIIDIAT